MPEHREQPPAGAERGLRIELRGLGKDYQLHGVTIEVLRDVDLVLEPGSVTALVGASGSGKSTALQLLGLLDRPSRGRLLFDGEDLATGPEHVVEDFRNRRIGFVFQFHHLLPEFTAVENVMMPLLIGGTPMRQARERARALLDGVGLGHRMQHAPGELSGGEQQRVALARAVAQDPALLLADEPTGNLDPRTGAAIHELLLQLNAEHGTTLLVATHNMQLAELLPRRLTIADRRIVEVEA